LLAYIGSIYLHRKNDFVEIFKNLAKYRSENNLDLENNDIEHLNVDDKIAKSFNILATSLNVLHVYSDPNKIIFKSISSKFFKY